MTDRNAVFHRLNRVPASLAVMDEELQYESLLRDLAFLGGAGHLPALQDTTPCRQLSSPFQTN